MLYFICLLSLVLMIVLSYYDLIFTGIFTTLFIICTLCAFFDRGNKRGK